jgi:hypothetical protein
MPALVFLRYLLLPATSLTMLVLVVVVSIGLSLAQFAGLFGLPIDLMLLSWLCNYSYISLEAIANGAREPPVLALEMLNPANEARPLFQLALIVIVIAILGMVVYLDPALAGALAILLLAALPASIGTLAVASSVWQSVHPEVLWHIARTLGAGYFAIVAVVLGYGFAIYGLMHFDILPLWPVIALGVFAWLSVFALIGGSIYEHREMLGHDAIDAPERRAARLQYEIDRERGRFLDGIHAQARSGNLAGAWDSIEHELATHRHDFAYYDWLLDRLGEREDVRLARRLAQDYIAKALGRDNARATSIAQRALRADPTFRPRSGTQCLRVADLLRLSGDRPGAQNLLSDFAAQFPGDPAIADAESMVNELKRQ